MEYKLINENNKVLYQKAAPWDFEKDGSPFELIKEMTRMMFENKGIGLAAPQLGVSKELFIMGNAELLIACVNPTYIPVPDTKIVKEIEGCLSFPNLWLHVDRWESIQATYLDASGKEINAEFSGIQARCFQHETDHLRGECFTSKVSKLSLDLAKKRQAKELKKISKITASVLRE